MKLLRVRLHGFGAFNDGLDVTFAPDQLNLIVGRNEAGKSTVMNSIFGVLFGFRDLNMARKYEPWDEHDAYAGELELQTEDGRKLVVHRDFNSNQCRVVAIDQGDHEQQLFEGRADPRGTQDEDMRYYELLAELFGFSDETVFRSTVFFGQQSLSTAVSDQIRRMLSGSTSVDFKGALHDLHARYSELTTENPWRSKARGRPRLIEQTQSALEADRTQLEDARQALDRSLELECEAADLELRIDQGTAELDSVRNSLDAHRRLMELLGRNEEANRRYEDALSRRDNFKRYADRAHEVEEEVARRYSHLKNMPEEFPERVRCYAEDQEAMQEELDELARLRKSLDGLRPKPNTKNGVTLGSVIGGATVLAGALTPVGPAVGLIAGAASGLLGFNIGRNIGTGFKEEKERLQQRVHELQASVKQRRKRSEELLAAAGPSLLGRDADTVIAEFRQFVQLRGEQKRLTAAMKALGDQSSMEAAFDEASRERGAVNAALEELAERHPSLVDLTDRARVGQEVERLRERLAGCELTVSQDRGRLETNRLELAGLGNRVNQNLSHLEEEVMDKERQLNRLDLERDALKSAIDTLDQCVKDFQEGDVLRLSEEMSAIFTRITDGKYTRIHLGTGLEPVVSRGDSVPILPENLSQGARDQLYFAMRVAMARHLSRNIKLPLFLDDPFVNFDGERLAITKDVLENLDDHQIIMVTCNRDYEPWTESVVDLDEVRSAA